MLPLTATRFIAPLVCFLLILAAEAGASVATLAGTWAIDIPATLDLVVEKNGEPRDETEKMLEAIGHMTVTFDLENHALIYRLTGTPIDDTVEKIEEISYINRVEEKSAGRLQLYLDGNSDPVEAFFLPDGRLRLGYDVVLTRPR